MDHACYPRGKNKRGKPASVDLFKKKGEENVKENRRYAKNLSLYP
jgi:hypothetical protein